jgi:sialidase-1
MKGASRDGTLFTEVLAVRAERGMHGHRGMPGDIVELEGGELLMSYAWNGSVMAVSSRDQGRSWGEPFALVPKPRAPASGSLGSPGFLRLSNRNILLSYTYTTHPRTPYYAHDYYRLSADEGKSWTDQYLMTPLPGYVLVHNDRLIALSTGRIVAFAEYKAHLPSTEDHRGFVGTAFFSDDQGYSWQVSRNTVDLFPDMEVQEPHGVELKDGRVMMWARTYTGHPVRAFTSDGCESWSKPEVMTEVPMPYAGLPTVTRIPSTRDLLFIWISEQAPIPDTKGLKRRCALTAAISRDEGQTLTGYRNIARDPEDDFGYQSIDFLGDTAVVSYHCRDGLRVARIGVDWFYGKG